MKSRRDGQQDGNIKARTGRGPGQGCRRPLVGGEGLGRRGGSNLRDLTTVDRCANHARAAAKDCESDALNRPEVAVVCERGSFRSA